MARVKSSMTTAEQYVVRVGPSVSSCPINTHSDDIISHTTTRTNLRYCSGKSLHTTWPQTMPFLPCAWKRGRLQSRTQTLRALGTRRGRLLRGWHFSTGVSYIWEGRGCSSYHLEVIVSGSSTAWGAERQTGTSFKIKMLTLKCWYSTTLNAGVSKVNFRNNHKAFIMNLAFLNADIFLLTFQGSKRAWIPGGGGGGGRGGGGGGGYSPIFAVQGCAAG